jgi:ubiquinone/menaquinone biosynthesis C-methylase UbiE
MKKHKEMLTMGVEFEHGYFETRFSFSKDRERLWPVLVAYLQRKYIPKDAIILDLGAGYCHFINYVQAKEKHALDISPIILKYAAADVITHVCSCTDMTELADSYFDVVFASNLFEHLERSAFWQALKEVRRVLKNGGKLIVIQSNFRLCYKSYFDDYTHIQVFTDKSLVDALESVGFKVTTVVPGFLPFSVKSRLPKNPLLLKIYLHLPYKPFAGQMLVVAENRK